MRTTHRMQTDTLAAIIKLGIGLPKKKPKRKKVTKTVFNPDNQDLIKIQKLQLFCFT